ncbi:MAG: ABC transporter permease [Cyclobacteriaceae bacterium]|tara:strand:- start:5977 stop:7236 length:1260 start_codon:yes stop_codon:yes gene_type:complete
MFDLDKWQEIFYTIDKNRLRSFITAFNVAWGIFILIILMGFGVGFQNGIKNEFSDDATNTMYFWSGRTSMAHKGMQPGRQIKFNNQDYEAISERVKGIEYLTGIYWVQGEFVVRYENNYSSFQIRSVDVDYPHIEQSVLLDGRFINAKDLKEKRKVAVVGEKVVEVLFKKLDPIGKYITVNGIKYKVVGVFNEKGVEANQYMSKVIFIPRTTAQVAYGGGDRIHNIWLTVDAATVEESHRIQNEVHALLAERHRFSKEDKRAVSAFNRLEEFQKWMGVFDGIRIFLAFVGILTLVAGIVGVSNIMLIVVKERTREIGVRKAIGASPLSIIGLFLMEALLITLVSGYVGMILAMTFIETGWLTYMMVSLGFPETFFVDPHVNFANALAATLVLAISGTLAGFFPARKAAKIPPIEALRDE